MTHNIPYSSQDKLYFIFQYLSNDNLSLQHAVLFVNGDQYYGAKAGLNVWAPRVTDQYEFSLSQIWVISGSFGNDLNTIEAGWQASLSLSYAMNILYEQHWTFYSSVKETSK